MARYRLGYNPAMPDNVLIKITPCWQALLASELEQPYWRALTDFVARERTEYTVYPPKRDTLSAFACPVGQVRVVVLGQDPYHGPDQAHGLAFSVPRGTKIPPSLRNIYREIHDDLNIPVPSHGDLSDWAAQGVMLLNTVLTVRAHTANSHRGQGWERFTDAVIKQLNTELAGLVFLLWGAAAGKKAQMIDSDKHLILQAPHPSPLSAYRGFFGCAHFSQINPYLTAQGLEPIDWRLDN